MEKEKRITSLKKEYEGIMQKHLSKAGLNERLMNFKFNIKLINEPGVYQKLFNSLRNQFKKLLEKMINEQQTSEKIVDYYEQIADFAEMVSFGSAKLTLRRVYSSQMSSKDFEVFDLLKALSKVPMNLSEEKFNELYCPIEVTYTNEHVQLEGYTYKESIKSTYHNTKRIINKNLYSYRLYDLATILTNVFLINTFEGFIKKNTQLIQFLLGNFMLQRHSAESIIRVPVNPEFKELYVKFLETFDLINGRELVEYDSLDYNYLELFMLGTKESTTLLIEKLSYQKRSYYLDFVTVELLSNLNLIKQKTDEESDQRNSARAFETKKNINQSTLEKMNNNKFLSHFSYVEIDDSVDLKKFHALEKEWEWFTEQVYIPKSSGTFRVKKLGRHKAAGIYFPHVNATIIDVDSPASLVHEIFHFIDFTVGNDRLLSEAVLFRPVIEAYKRSVIAYLENLEEGNPLHAQMNGKSKFNLGYYLQPTEIFARSGEIYLNQKGIKNSFLKESYKGFQYPNDAEYLRELNRYFNTFFDMYDAPVVAKERPFAASRLLPVSDNEQLIEFNEDKGQLRLF